MDISNVYELKKSYESRYPDMHFFDKETLKFFGERLSEMYLYKKKEIVMDYYGNNHLCYVLKSYQRNHPLGPRNKYHYFDTNTLKIIITED